MKTGQFPNLLDTMPHTLCSLSYPATPREKANIESLFHYKNISYLKKKIVSNTYTLGCPVRKLTTLRSPRINDKDSLKNYNCVPDI